VHEATYGSRLGERTDLFDWKDKFENHLEEILRVDGQDAVLPAGRRNTVVLFKSCFPNNDFVGAGTPPGDPTGPELTEANARAALTALLPEFQKHPDVLFVYLTAPPLSPFARDERLLKIFAKRLLGKPTAKERLRKAGEIARRFNTWVSAPGGWLAGYPRENVVVFDLFSVLTASAQSGLSAYGSEGGTDSHPSAEGNGRAVARLVPFLNAAVAKGGFGAREPAPAAPAPTPSPSL
jgi:hypothetical protein